MLGCMRRTRMQCNAHDDMIKCNTHANDMATMANNWQTPGASNPGCYTFLEQTSSRRLGVEVRDAMRQPRGRRARPHPRGPLVAPLTDFLCLYISTYPENIQEHHKPLFPPPQPSIPVRSHLGAFSDALSEGESITEGFYINAKASPMSCE